MRTLIWKLRTPQFYWLRIKKGSIFEVRKGLQKNRIIKIILYWREDELNIWLAVKFEPQIMRS